MSDEDKPRPGQIVPFGKYKGQPLEVMATDRNYVEWLTAQPWFRERFQPLYTVIVNQFQEPSETPEHNALQVLFLEPRYRLAFIETASPGASRRHLEWLGRKREQKISEARTKLDFERKCLASSEEMDAILPDQPRWVVARIQLAERDLEQAEVAAAPTLPDVSVTFERGGVDVSITGLGEFAIEIKPSVADDYPAVLRQMRANGSKYLFLERYDGRGATEAQFVATFESAGIKVVFRRDVEAALHVEHSPHSGPPQETR